MSHKREREDYELKRRVEEEALLNLEFQMNQRVASLQVGSAAEIFMHNYQARSFFACSSVLYVTWLLSLSNFAL